jgi:cytochrome c
MDFFKDFVVPPSANHILLLKYLLAISMLIFLPYIGMLMGSSLLSFYFNRAGKQEQNKLYIKFSKDIIEKLTITRNAFYVLGILPLISIILSYTQLLYEAGTIAVPIIAFSGVLFVVAFAFIYKYRNAYEIESVIESLKKNASTAPKAKDDMDASEINEYEENIIRSKSHSGWLGIMFLYVAVYIFAGSTALASNPGRWSDVDNILQIIFSWATIFNFLYLLFAAGAVTGAAVLFYFFKWQDGLTHMNNEYSGFTKSFASNLALFSSLTLPVLLFVNIFFLPKEAMSPSFFLYHILALIGIILLCNVLYLSIKNSDTRFSTSAFSLILIVFAFYIFQGNVAFGDAIAQQTLASSIKAEELDKKLQSENVVVANVDPQQIYNTKCFACHKFDVKLVGPPYEETVPKYHGDVNKLADFIFSPKQNNPGYPPMPNQGLSKPQAIAMAKWLIEKVGEKK